MLFHTHGRRVFLRGLLLGVINIDAWSLKMWMKILGKFQLWTQLVLFVKCALRGYFLWNFSTSIYGHKLHAIYFIMMQETRSSIIWGWTLQCFQDIWLCFDPGDMDHDVKTIYIHLISLHTWSKTMITSGSTE